MNKVLFISPKDSTLGFIQKLHKTFACISNLKFQLIEIGYSDKEHEKALNEIELCDKTDLIIFVGHGGSDYWQGSVDRKGNSFKKEKFLNVENIDILNDRKVLSISCNSSEKLGQLAKEAGAITFMGFGNLPTEVEIIQELKKPQPLLIKHFKYYLTLILKKSLEYAIENNCTFLEFQSLINFYSNKSILKIQKTRIRNKKYLIDWISNIALDNKIFANRFIKLIE